MVAPPAWVPRVTHLHSLGRVTDSLTNIERRFEALEHKVEEVTSGVAGSAVVARRGVADSNSP